MNKDYSSPFSNQMYCSPCLGCSSYIQQFFCLPSSPPCDQGLSRLIMCCVRGYILWHWDASTVLPKTVAKTNCKTLILHLSEIFTFSFQNFIQFGHVLKGVETVACYLASPCLLMCLFHKHECWHGCTLWLISQRGNSALLLCCALVAALSWAHAAVSFVKWYFSRCS